MGDLAALLRARKPPGRQCRQERRSANEEAARFAAPDGYPPTRTGGSGVLWRPGGSPFGRSPWLASLRGTASGGQSHLAPAAADHCRGTMPSGVDRGRPLAGDHAAWRRPRPTTAGGPCRLASAAVDRCRGTMPPGVGRGRPLPGDHAARRRPQSTVAGGPCRQASTAADHCRGTMPPGVGRGRPLPGAKPPGLDRGRPLLGTKPPGLDRTRAWPARRGVLPGACDSDGPIRAPGTGHREPREATRGHRSRTHHGGGSPFWLACAPGHQFSLRGEATPRIKPVVRRPSSRTQSQAVWCLPGAWVETGHAALPGPEQITEATHCLTNPNAAKIRFPGGGRLPRLHRGRSTRSPRPRQAPHRPPIRAEGSRPGPAQNTPATCAAVRLSAAPGRFGPSAAHAARKPSRSTSSARLPRGEKPHSASWETSSGSA